MRQKAFTLIELIVVIAIIIILAAAMVPVYQRTTGRARTSRANSEADSIRTAVLTYNSDTGAWPAIGTAGAGIIATDNTANWNGPYLQVWPNDPWGRPYRLQAVPAGTANSRQITSLGADNAAGGIDDNADVTIIINP